MQKNFKKKNIKNKENMEFPTNKKLKSAKNTNF